MVYLFGLFVFTIFAIVNTVEKNKNIDVVFDDLLETYLYQTYIVRKNVNNIPDDYACFKDIVYNMSNCATNKTSKEFISFLLDNSKQVDKETQAKLVEEIISILKLMDEELKMIVVWYFYTGALINNNQSTDILSEIESNIEKIEDNNFVRTSFDTICLA